MRFLVEGYKAIEYKGYIIERDEDSLEQAIADAEENGRLEYDFIFRVIKNKKVLDQFDNLREARAFIDGKVEEELKDLETVVYNCISEYMDDTINRNAGRHYSDIIEDLSDPACNSPYYRKRFEEMENTSYDKYNSQLDHFVINIIYNSGKWWYDRSEDAI